MFAIFFNTHAQDDLLLIPKTNQRRIELSIKKKLCKYPELFGVKLRGSLRDYWKLRVGDYRVGYVVREKTIIILAIKHRKEIYRILERRIR